MPDKTLDIAVQTSPQPTNKVAAASNAAAAAGVIIAGVMAAYGGPAILELLGAWGQSHPNTAQLIVMIVSGLAGGVGGKYVPQVAAYNVLDKPNVPLKPVSSEG